MRKRLSWQNLTKWCVNLWKNVKLTRKFNLFLPLKSLSRQFHVAKKPFRIIEYLQQNFLTWVWPFPHPLNLSKLLPGSHEGKSQAGPRVVRFSYCQHQVGWGTWPAQGPPARSQSYHDSVTNISSRASCDAKHIYISSHQKQGKRWSGLFEHSALPIALLHYSEKTNSWSTHFPFSHY